MAKKSFEDYTVNEIITHKGNRYEVVLKAVRSWFSKGANKTFKRNILYLKAIDTTENRVAKVTSRGTLEFEWKEALIYKPIRGEGKRVYETWRELPTLK